MREKMLKQQEYKDGAQSGDLLRERRDQRANNLKKGLIVKLTRLISQRFELN